MKLTNREAGILDYIINKKPAIKTVASALNIKKSNLSNYVKKLQKWRMISVTKQGQNKILNLSDLLWLGFLGARNKIHHIKFKDILVGYTPFLLSFVKDKQNFKVSELDLPQATAKRVLKKLRSQGIVYSPLKGIYLLREEAYPLADFCRNTIMQIYSAEAEAELKNITQAYFSFKSSKKLEVIFVTDEEAHPKSYWPTSYEVFHKYGLQLISAGKHYYTNTKPGLEEVIIHTLALNKDARSIMYVATLMIKNKFGYVKLLGKKQHFDLADDFIKNLFDFVNTKGVKTFEGFPSWKEVRDVAYG